MIGAIGVCSWSLEPRGPEHLEKRVLACGLTRVRLALDRLRLGTMPQHRLERAFARSGLSCCSGMMAMAGEDYSTPAAIARTGGVVPDDTWAENLAAAHENARIARSLGLPLVTFHAGFIPHDARDVRRAVLLDRLRQLRDVFAAADVRVALETGQERAQTLLELLAELPGVGVNFDPANMLLYDMDDPLPALAQLLPHVVQVHIKDARRPASPGEWGTEVPAGEGDVPWAGFLAALSAAGGTIDLVIEREAGEARVDDVRRAVALLRAHGVS